MVEFLKILIFLEHLNYVRESWNISMTSDARGILCVRRIVLVAGVVHFWGGKIGVDFRLSKFDVVFSSLCFH